MANYQSTHTGQEHDAYCVKSQLIDLVYPVGAIYMSVNSTSPQTLFGGTWQQISDTFLLAAGSTYSAGSTGGEATHTLTVAEMPSHSHNLYMRRAGNPGYYEPYPSWATNQPNATLGWVGGNISNTGGDGAHNNMPPYLAVYVWKRTA